MSASTESKSEQSISNAKLGRRVILGGLIAAFSAANIAVIGWRNGWWRPKYEIAVAGPFKDGIASEIHPVVCDFVDPKSVRISSSYGKRRDLEVGVKFEFKGNKIPNRIIQITVTAIGFNGKLIGAYTTKTTDARISASTPMKWGRHTLTIQPANTVAGTIPIPKDGVSGISRLEIRFVEVKG